jgi:hypothetical protein
MPNKSIRVTIVRSRITKGVWHTAMQVCRARTMRNCKWRTIGAENAASAISAKSLNILLNYECD